MPLGFPLRASWFRIVLEPLRGLILPGRERPSGQISSLSGRRGGNKSVLRDLRVFVVQSLVMFHGAGRGCEKGQGVYDILHGSCERAFASASCRGGTLSSGTDLVADARTLQNGQGQCGKLTSFRGPETGINVAIYYGVKLEKANHPKGWDAKPLA